MTKMAGNYNYTQTLLVMPEAEKLWRRRDEDEEPVEDSYDRFGVGGRVMSGAVRRDVTRTAIGRFC